MTQGDHAGAGGVVHLPGLVAAMTALPVIGVLVKGSSLDGVDSCVSTIPRPGRPTHIYWQRGVPVATVAINNGTNAELLATQILGACILHLGGGGGVGKICERNGEGSTRKGGKVELLGWGWVPFTVQSQSRDQGRTRAYGFVVCGPRLGLYIVCKPAIPVTLYDTQPTLFESNPAYPSYSSACELIHRQLAPHSQAPDLADLLRPLQFL